MSLKQILLILGVLTFTLFTTVGAFLWLYKTKPEVLGIRPAAGTADSLSLAVSDSARVFQEHQKKKKEEEMRWKRQIDSLSSALAKTKTSLSSANLSYDSLKQELQSTLQQQEREEEAFTIKMDSITRANYQTFAKIYDNANPPEVARILQNIDGREAAVILKLMKKKQAGKVLEAMNPERAADILRLSSYQF